MDKIKTKKIFQRAIIPLAIGGGMIGLTCFYLKHENQTDLSVLKQVEVKNTDSTISPVLQGSNPDNPSLVPSFNVSTLTNINPAVELKYSSLHVTASQARTIILRNMTSFFGSTLTEEAFIKYLKPNTFTVLNRPTVVYVSFTLQSVLHSNDEKPGDKVFNLTLTGFQEAEWAQMTWIIFMGPVFAIVIIALVIALTATRLRLAKRRTPHIEDGELIIE